MELLLGHECELDVMLTRRRASAAGLLGGGKAARAPSASAAAIFVRASLYPSSRICATESMQPVSSRPCRLARFHICDLGILSGDIFYSHQLEWDWICSCRAGNDLMMQQVTLSATQMRQEREQMVKTCLTRVCM